MSNCDITLLKPLDGSDGQYVATENATYDDVFEAIDDLKARYEKVTVIIESAVETGSTVLSGIRCRTLNTTIVTADLSDADDDAIRSLVHGETMTDQYAMITLDANSPREPNASQT